MQYLKKEVSDEVDFLHTYEHQHFLHADKHQIFLQVHTPFLRFLRVWSAMSKVPRKVYNIFVISQEQS